MVTRIEAWFDGACEPVNPGGYAGAGALMKIDGEIVWTFAKIVGSGPTMSNNVAEYAACNEVLSRVATVDGIAQIFGDSKLVVMQLLGHWKVRGGLYLPYYQQARESFSRVRDRVSLEWIPREENSEADELSKLALKSAGVEFRIQRTA